MLRTAAVLAQIVTAGGRFAMGLPEGLKAAGAWDFAQWGQLEGWSVPEELQGRVLGGCLWLALERGTLAWSTVKTFDSNWPEYVVPSTGSGEGVQRYE